MYMTTSWIELFVMFGGSFRCLLTVLTLKVQSAREKECFNPHMLSTMTDTLYIHEQMPSVLSRDQV